MKKNGDHLQNEYQVILKEACQRTLDCEQGYRELLDQIGRLVDGKEEFCKSGMQF